jgi:hypothetical protein
MRTRTDRERSYRRAVAGGVVLSIAAHIAVFAFGSMVVVPPAESGRFIRLVQLADVMEPSQPLEVVQLRVQPEFSERQGGSASSYAADVVAAPAFAPLPASLRVAIPNPLALLRVIEVKEKPENPVASYAYLSDFAVDASANPRALRSMDDRPLAVLAALASVGQGSGATIGGGHCPSPGIFR